MTERFKKQAADNRAKFENWQREQQAQQQKMNKGKDFKTRWQEWFNQFNQNKDRGPDIKSRFQQFWSKEFNRKKQDGPDPFFKMWQQTSNENPDQAYYKDLVRKIFLATGALIFLRLITGS